MHAYVSFSIAVIAAIIMVFAPVFIGALLAKAVNRKAKHAWLWLAGGMCCLLFICWQYFVLAQAGSLSSTIAILGAFITSVISFSIGVVMYLSQRNYGHTLGALLGVGFPLVLAISVAMGVSTAWNYPFEGESRAITRALEQYKHANNQYPDTLDRLVPTYVSKIPMAGNCTGWSYEGSGTQYALRCEGYIDQTSAKHAYCAYSSFQPEWTCISLTVNE